MRIPSRGTVRGYKAHICIQDPQIKVTSFGAANIAIRSSLVKPQHLDQLPASAVLFGDVSIGFPIVHEPHTRAVPL